MAFIMEGPPPLDMIAREAAGSRSRDAITVSGNAMLPPGTLLAGEIGGTFARATTAAAVTAILLYWADPRGGPVGASALTRDCEVNDAYLVYGTMDPVAVATALREQGIIPRVGVLANPASEFAASHAEWPSPSSIPSAAALADNLEPASNPSEQFPQASREAYDPTTKGPIADRRPPRVPGPSAAEAEHRGDMRPEEHPPPGRSKAGHPAPPPVA